MLNLRQLNKSEHTQASSALPPLSQVSVPNLRVPSGLLGNIGEPLDHEQMERYIYEDGKEALELSFHNAEGSLTGSHSKVTGSYEAYVSMSSDLHREGDRAKAVNGVIDNIAEGSRHTVCTPVYCHSFYS